MIAGSENLYKETTESLARIRDFDVQTLPRITDLGSQMNFSEIVEPAQRLIDFYKNLSIMGLQDFPNDALKLIRDHANDNYHIFSVILDFDPGQADPSKFRTNLINAVSTAYQSAFQELNQYISYSLQGSFRRLNSDAMAALQAIKDKAKEISDNVAAHETQAKSALREILDIAAEGGVTKQAVHFNAEHEHHTQEAAKWQKSTVKWARVLIAFAVLSIFIHKAPFLKPENIYDAIQLSISKFLIFSVMAYMLFLSAKNFLNHKHNSIVNKHRQNALMTHAALVEASGDLGVRDAVLLQASSCIFSPQSTGYTVGGENDLSNQKSMVEILSRPVVQAIKGDDK